MRSPKTFSGLFLAAWLAGTLTMQAGEESLIRADLGYATKYVFRGVERTGAAAQTAIELSRENFHGGVWANLPFKGGEEREVNLNAAYAWQAMEGLKLEVSARQYWFSNVSASGIRHSFEAGIAATIDSISGFTPSLSYAHDFRLQADTVQASLARSIALTGFGAFLDLNIFGGWATGDNWRPDAPGARRHDNYGYWGAEAHLPYRIGPHSTLIAGLHYADALGRSVTNGPFDHSARHIFWVTLGVSLDF